MLPYSRVSELSPTQMRSMRGVSWYEDLGCPEFSELAHASIPFIDFRGQEQVGALIVLAELAESVVDVFEKLRALSFPIARMRPMHEFSGDDGASMIANNCSCFNGRRILGSTRISLHALGRAIDINPIQNPVIRDGCIRPKAGAAFLDRDRTTPGMISPGCGVIEAFSEAGWKWGGDWKNPKDYHHFFLP